MEKLKSGFLTSEFALALLVKLIGILGMFFAGNPWVQAAGALAAACAAVGYAAFRSRLKAVAIGAAIGAIKGAAGALAPPKAPSPVLKPELVDPFDFSKAGK